MDFQEDKEISVRLKAYREKWNLSARKFAIRAGVDVSQYSKAEAGAIAVSQKMLQKILEAYPDLTKEYVLFGRQGHDEDRQEAAVPASDFIGVADTILQLMTPVNAGDDVYEQVRLYREREEKLFMALEILKTGIIALNQKLSAMNDIQKAG